MQGEIEGEKRQRERGTIIIASEGEKNQDTKMESE